MQRLVTGMATLAACLILGCGSSGEEATATPLSKAQFQKQASAICTKFAKQRQAAAAAWLKEQSGGPTKAQSHYDEGFKEVVAPSMRQEAAELESIVPPDALAAQVERMIGGFRQASEAIAQKGTDGVTHPGLRSFEEESEALGIPNCPNPL